MTTAQKKTATTNGSPIDGLQLGLPSARLQKLLASVTVAQPYEITDGITIAPPTKRRRDAMHEAQTNLIIHTQALEKAYTRVGPIRPEYPATPQPPAKMGQEDIEAYGVAVEHWQKLVAEWETQNAEWEAAVARREAALDDLQTKIRDDQEVYTKELFGDAYQAVDEFFDGQPVELWNAFVEDIKVEFGITPKPAQLPDDGSCPACGRVEDEDAAGKALTSSTGSNTTGTP